MERQWRGAGGGPFTPIDFSARKGGRSPLRRKDGPPPFTDGGEGGEGGGRLPYTVACFVVHL